MAGQLQLGYRLINPDMVYPGIGFNAVAGELALGAVVPVTALGILGNLERRGSADRTACYSQPLVDVNA